MKNVLRATGLLTLLAPLGSAQGALVFEQLPNYSNYTFSDAGCDVCGLPPLGTGQQSVAENFVINTSTGFQLNQVVLWGVHDGGSATDPNLFTVRIFDVNGLGEPNVLLYGQAAVPTVAVPTGVTYLGEAEVECTLTIPNAPLLSSGTYWIEIFNDTSSASATWGWMSADVDPFNGIEGFSFAIDTPAQQWFADNYATGSPARNLAMRLFGDGATVGGPIQPYCFGAVCPCGNNDAAAGCLNSTGSGALLGFSGSANLFADDLQLSATNLLPGQPALLIVGENAINGGNGNPFGDGLRCVGMNVLRLGVASPDANGDASWGPGLAAGRGWVGGDVRRFQVWYRDPINSACGAAFNLTNAVEVIWQ